MGSAILSPCGLYRYHLRRDWTAAPPLVWIMLNPSTADAEQDDPTIRRCIAFAKAFGYGGIEVVNLFALRSPSPADLLDSSCAGIDPVGPNNDDTLRVVIVDCGYTLVAAWGAHKLASPRARVIERMAAGRLLCLGTTKDGSPRHPLYVKASQPLVPYPPLTPAPDQR